MNSSELKMWILTLKRSKKSDFFRTNHSPFTSTISSMLSWLSGPSISSMKNLFNYHFHLILFLLWFTPTWLKFHSQHLPLIFFIYWRKKFSEESLISLSWSQWGKPWFYLLFSTSTKFSIWHLLLQLEWLEKTWGSVTDLLTESSGGKVHFRLT